MENEPHNEPYAVADGVSDDPPENAVGETYADQEPEPPVESEPLPSEEPLPATPGGEIGRRPMRSGAEAGAGAALAEAGSAAGPPGEGAFGAWLRRQREIREIDLREIADKTKISLRYLKAMEQDRFEVLPAPIFARGFLREYARYVGLDADEVVNYYLAAHHPAGDDDADETLSGSRRLRGDGRGPLTRGALIGFVVLLVLAALAYWFFYERSRDVSDRPPPPIATPAADRPVTPPADAADAAPTASAASTDTASPDTLAPTGAATLPLVVTFDFTEKCWLEVQVDGGRRLSRNYVAGESLQIEAERQVTLETVGNVAGVEVQVNGQPYELPTAGSGRTARGVVIDLESAATPRES